MTDQTTNAASQQPTADPSEQRIPFYRNPWLNYAIAAIGIFFDPIVLIWTLIEMWTGPSYQGVKRPYKQMGMITKAILSILFLGSIAWAYGGLISKFQTAGCSSPEAIALVKQIAKRQNIAAINYDNVEITAIRTLANDRPNGGSSCAARMTNIQSQGDYIKEVDIKYTIDVTDKRDQILVNMFIQ